MATPKKKRKKVNEIRLIDVPDKLFKSIQKDKGRLTAGNYVIELLEKYAQSA